MKKIIFLQKIITMNKHYLISQMKSTGTAYILWFFIGCHYAYLGKWGTQILFWITLGGLGIWALIDLFRIPSLVSNYNYQISLQLDSIEKKEKEESLANNLAMVNASKNYSKNEERRENTPFSEVKETPQFGFAGHSKKAETSISHQNQIDQLRELKSLLDENILTKEEFESQKSKILG